MMLYNSIRPILGKIFQNTNIPVRYSALYINGKRATDTYVFVTPHVDIKEKIQEKEKVESEIIRRKSNYNMAKLKNLWSMYEELKQRVMDLEKKRAEVGSELNKIMKLNPNSDETKQHKIKIDLIKDAIKTLKNPLWSAEEAAMVEALKLPNTLHPLTPKEKEILYSHSKPPIVKKNHLDIGKELDVISFRKNENYYLKGEAAVYELGAKFYCSDILRQHKFTQFSNADFVKSVIVEGCGEEHTDPNKTFILHHNEDGKVNIDNRLHLTGGSSLYSFLAYHTKHVVYSKVLPLKYYSIGRNYVPSPVEENSLFNVSQSSVVQIFGATRDDTELQNIFNDVINIMKELYMKVGHHFRLTLTPAENLHMWESLRVSVEMFSTSLDQYVEVANISLSGDFISKRLMFTYVDNKQNKFPHILSGTILNVPKLLACTLEQDMDFVVPNIFQVNNWSL